MQHRRSDPTGLIQLTRLPLSAAMRRTNRDQDDQNPHFRSHGPAVEQVRDRLRNVRPDRSRCRRRGLAGGAPGRESRTAHNPAGFPLRSGPARLHPYCRTGCRRLRTRCSNVADVLPGGRHRSGVSPESGAKCCQTDTPPKIAGACNGNALENLLRCKRWLSRNYNTLPLVPPGLDSVSSRCLEIASCTF